MSPFLLRLLFSMPGLISAGVGIAIWRRRTSRAESLLALLMFATTFWTLGYCLELAANSVVAFWILGVVQYIGIATAPVCFFLSMVHYAGIETWPTRKMTAALFAVPVTTIILRITDPLHGLVHRFTEIHIEGSMTYQVHHPGPWFWVTIAYSYLMLWCGVIILLYFRSSARVIHRRHMTLLVAGSLAPLAGSIAYITGHRPLGFVDLTPLGFTFTGLAVAWAALANRILDIIPVARTALVDSFPDGLLMLDRRGRILDMNATAAGMLRLDVGASLGMNAGEMLREWPALRHLCARAVEGRAEFEDQRAGGGDAVRYLEARLTFLRQYADEVSASLVVVTDITDRKRAEERLGKSEALYHDLVETAQDLIWQCDAGGRFTYLNPAWKDVFGCEPAEMLGKTFADFQPPGDAPLDREHFDRFMDSPREYEVTLAGRNKQEVHLILKGKRVYGAHGAFVGSRGTAHDMTDRKRIEEELRQAMKMEAVGRLAGGVAHDFNNLLQAIMGYTELAIHEISSKHPARPLLEAVAKAGDRATTLVRQLLAFSRRQVICPEQLNLNDVIAAFLAIMRRVIGEHIHIDFIAGPALGTVFADRGQLEQVLMNLCANARDAMPDGGALRIETGAVSFGETYCIAHPWARPGDYVMLTVADTGIGMDAATMNRVWEPFFTTKAPGKGTGLGLATVYGIVQQHEGLIDAESRLGEGTAFHLYFPRTEGTAAPIKSDEELPAPGGRETILLAEDEEAVRTLATNILERAGYTVLASENGAEALDIAAQNQGNVALALLDVVMPVLGGRAAYEQLKARYPGMRFLFVSGHDAEMANTGFVLGEGHEFLQKPFDRGVLLRKVRELLDRK